ncbi:Nn.00g077040.m01.CDS01 [Neocucurbitaria sp. VM-36]
MAANYYQQWKPQFQQTTSYQPVYHVEPVQWAPPAYNAKPTEYFVQEVEQHPKPQQTWFQAHFGGLKRTLRFFLAIAITVLVINISWLIWAKVHYGDIESGYNSLVFVSLSSNDYYWTIATQEFPTGASYNLTGRLQTCGADSPCWVITDLPDGSSDSSVVFLPYNMDKVDKLYAYYDQIQKNASIWEKLSNHDCIQAYSNVFLSGRRNVILVSSDKNDTNSVFDYGISKLEGGDFDNNWWICSEGGQDGGNKICQPDSYLSKADNWTVWNYPIDHCLSERVTDVCEVEFSMSIMIVVIVFNLIKVFAMTWVLLRYDAEKILTSVGDAASNFLTTEDHTTRGMCLAGRHNITQLWRQPGTGIPYHPQRQRWAGSVSKGKWTLFILLMLISFGLIAIFGAWGFSHTKHRGVSLSFSSLWQLGFGAAHQDAVVIYDDVYSTISMAFLANIPQIFLAAVWLVYMGIMTSMFLAADWSVFGTKGQTLIVSSPRGDQRGTWLLSAPLVYGIPLLVLQVILHWLVSQSIFVISLSVYNPDGSLNQSNPKFLNCGYSPIAIIFTVIASVLLMLSVIALAFRRFPQGAPPVVATCSAAISAACHIPIGMQKHDLSYAPLRWGQCGQPQYGVGHCALMPDDSFKNGYAQAPSVGWVYA